MDSRSYYEFDCFLLDTKRQCLLCNGNHVPLQPKTYAVLLLLVQNAGRTVSRDELMEAAWGLSISEGVLNFQINQLRKQLRDTPSNPKYIQTITKRGFQFIAAVKETEECSSKIPKINDTKPSVELMNGMNGSNVTIHPEQEKAQEAVRKQPVTKISQRLIISGIALLLLTGIGIAIWWYYGNTVSDVRTKVEIHSSFDEGEVRRVVKDSQFFETLSLYTNPKAVKREDLATYWLPAEMGGKEIKEVLAAIERLLNSGWHYGSESKCEMFEFFSTRILAPGDSAEVETIERWYIPTYKDDGSRVLERNVFLGPLKMAYKLRKLNGMWLIEETTVPRPRKE
jgi:DNA-binding winged helix-turn-helix (wHTH) protein